LAGPGRAHPRWPGNARIAVQFVINYAEAARNNVLHGGQARKAFLSEIIGAQPIAGQASHEHEVAATNIGQPRRFSGGCSPCLPPAAQIPVTVYGRRRWPLLLAIPRRSPHADSRFGRFATHASLDRLPARLPEETSASTCSPIEISTPRHRQPAAPLVSRRTSPNTRRIVVEEGGFVYDADRYATSCPYWDDEHGRPQLIVPYTLDANDMRSDPAGLQQRRTSLLRLFEG